MGPGEENAVRSTSTTRRLGDDLLVRPPSGVGDPDGGWTTLLVDPAAQLGELADLTSRGLLSQEEYEVLKRRIVGVRSA